MLNTWDFKGVSASAYRSPVLNADTLNALQKHPFFFKYGLASNLEPSKNDDAVMTVFMLHIAGH